MDELKENTSAALTLLDAPPPVIPLDDGFEDFWRAYPRRNNLRGSRKLALTEWRKLKPDDRAEAMRMLAHYGRGAGGYPVDAERYLKRKLWEGVEERAPGLQGTAARLAAKAREMGLTEGGRG